MCQMDAACVLPAEVVIQWGGESLRVCRLHARFVEYPFGRLGSGDKSTSLESDDEPEQNVCRRCMATIAACNHSRLCGPCYRRFKARNYYYRRIGWRVLDVDAWLRVDGQIDHRHKFFYHRRKCGVAAPVKSAAASDRAVPECDGRPLPSPPFPLAHWIAQVYKP